MMCKIVKAQELMCQNFIKSTKKKKVKIYIIVYKV